MRPLEPAAAPPAATAAPPATAPAPAAPAAPALPAALAPAAVADAVEPDAAEWPRWKNRTLWNIAIGPTGSSAASARLVCLSWERKVLQRLQLLR